MPKALQEVGGFRRLEGGSADVTFVCTLGGARRFLGCQRQIIWRGVRAHAVYDRNESTKGGPTSSAGASLRQRQGEDGGGLLEPLVPLRPFGRPEARGSHSTDAHAQSRGYMPHGARRETCTTYVDMQAHVHTYLLACMATLVCLCAHVVMPAP